MTLDEVRQHGRMAHHDPMPDGVEWWWGPNAGHRLYFRHGFDTGFGVHMRGAVLHIDPYANAVAIPCLDPLSVSATFDAPAAMPTFMRMWFHAPRDDWHHMAGCDCEVCR